MTTVDQTAALIRAHFGRDDDQFTVICRQIIAAAERKNQRTVARRLTAAIQAGQNGSTPGMVALPRRGEIAKLLEGWEVSVERDALLVSDQINRQIDDVIEEYRRREQLQDAGFRADTKLLLEGPPGTGKTMTAAVIASALDLPMYLVSLAGTIDSHLGETGKNLELLFGHMRTNPAVYVFDEIDALATRRDAQESDIGEMRRTVNTMLMALDRTVENSVMVATTNLASTLDHALFRRFDRVITYSHPTRAVAVDVLSRRLGPLVSGLDLEAIGDDLIGLSHADITAAAERAAKRSIVQQTALTVEDIREALSDRKDRSPVVVSV